MQNIIQYVEQKIGGTEQVNGQVHIKVLSQSFWNLSFKIDGPFEESIVQRLMIRPAVSFT